MENTRLVELLHYFEGEEGHIFYHFENQEKYLQNVITFITTGVKLGSNIILIENDRNISRIKETLNKKLNPSEIDKVLLINNFDFYFENKCFDPQRIYAYYKQSIQPSLDNNIPVWTWGLVEWGDDKEILNQIEIYEKKVDRYVNEKGIISVCAYDKTRTPNGLKDMLIKCHSVMLTDDTVIFPSKMDTSFG